MIRIIGGRWRGRRIGTPDGLALRPTAERAREALFNLLGHNRWLGDFELAGSQVLDGFAGTGALGLEALSRGAARAVFLERDQTALAQIEANIQALGAGDQAVAMARDATRPGKPPAAARFDLVLLDPPYRSGLSAATIAALDMDGWLAADPVIAVEHGARETFDPPAGFVVVDRRRYGAATIQLLRRSGSASMVERDHTDQG